MKVRYRFTFGWTAKRALKLEQIGATVDPSSDFSGECIIGVVHSAEGAPEWADVSSLIREWGGSFLVTTDFSAAEIAAADYCELQVTHANGYPQPEDDFGFRAQTYDTSKYCDECGAWAVQIAPFRVRKSLKWGRNAFLKLFWVEDAIFMHKDVWEAHLAPLGIETWPVEDTKGNVLDQIVQLRADTSVALQMDEDLGVRCPKCGRVRYTGPERGFLPAPVGNPDLPIFRSEQFFGAGHQSSNAILIRRDVVAVIQSAKLRGAKLWPCAAPE
ncbi:MULTISPECIES: hypothetical protein [Stenotrophomonas maltophilia group]|uniref:hypothetical protein n=1 Tax=Stenotrophomonas maltophilia group TaxID=995085 RepID=UPI000F675F1E|nr:hypothetical protein [Stenotrophomonas maltophilia]RRU75260.1 hypothetical protein EGJ89_04700 [Stenotrophomonas maltophilia]